MSAGIVDTGKNAPARDRIPSEADDDGFPEETVMGDDYYEDDDDEEEEPFVAPVTLKVPVPVITVEEAQQWETIETVVVNGQVIEEKNERKKILDHLRSS
jgi:hypothetical protein